jgi:hypothetical protein
MISRSLTRRLEDLESRYQPVGDGEQRIYCIEYVDNDLKVVDRIELKTPGWIAYVTGKRTRP